MEVQLARRIPMAIGKLHLHACLQYLCNNNLDYTGHKKHIHSTLLRAAVHGLRGSTPFEDMIFYLWTDSNEICTAYVKLRYLECSGSSLLILSQLIF